MGLTVYYRSTEPVPPQTRAAINAAADELCQGRTWLSCEPVCFLARDEDGHLMGGCKPNLTPHPDDVAAAEAEDLPDGEISDAMEVLCELSRQHRIDWKISHDYAGSIGFIRDGMMDPEVIDQVEVIGSVRGFIADAESFEDPRDDGGENDHPRILPFRPRGN